MPPNETGTELSAYLALCRALVLDPACPRFEAYRAAERAVIEARELRERLAQVDAGLERIHARLDSLRVPAGGMGGERCSDPELTDPCVRCEEREAVSRRNPHCAECSELAAEDANERLHEGEPPVSADERHQMAHAERRAQRGY